MKLFLNILIPKEFKVKFNCNEAMKDGRKVLSIRKLEVEFISSPINC